MEIRRAVQRGDVVQATGMVNELDPEVSLQCLVFRGRVSKIIMYYAPLSGSFLVVTTLIRSR
jgi:hypothetical protein